jgi:hypothetical protein
MPSPHWGLPARPARGALHRTRTWWTTRSPLTGIPRLGADSPSFPPSCDRRDADTSGARQPRQRGETVRTATRQTRVPLLTKSASREWGRAGVTPSDAGPPRTDPVFSCDVTCPRWELNPHSAATLQSLSWSGQDLNLVRLPFRHGGVTLSWPDSNRHFRRVSAPASTTDGIHRHSGPALWATGETSDDLNGADNPLLSAVAVNVWGGVFVRGEGARTEPGPETSSGSHAFPPTHALPTGFEPAPSRWVQHRGL